MSTNEKHIDTFDDIIFEKRNKEYGAYYIRRKYPKWGAIAFGIAFFIVSNAVAWPLVASIINRNVKKEKMEKNVLVEMTNIKKENEEAPPPPPPPPPPPTVDVVKFTAPKIVDTVKEEVQLATIDGLKDANNNTPIDTTTIIAVVNNNDPIPTNETEEIFTIVEESPEFPGGQAALQQYINTHIEYPALAKESEIQGKVILRFVVKGNGEVGEVQILRGVDPLLDAEAIRVVKTLPKWNPGKQRGQPVSVWFSLPINFALQ